MNMLSVPAVGSADEPEFVELELVLAALATGTENV
jgi:hypothetical protein